MDILNSIWTAISTPNEELINLIFIPIAFLLEGPLSFSLISTVFNIDFNKKD